MKCAAHHVEPNLADPIRDPRCLSRLDSIDVQGPCWDHRSVVLLSASFRSINGSPLSSSINSVYRLAEDREAEELSLVACFRIKNYHPRFLETDPGHRVCDHTDSALRTAQKNFLNLFPGQRSYRLLTSFEVGASGTNHQSASFPWPTIAMESVSSMA